MRGCARYIAILVAVVAVSCGHQAEALADDPSLNEGLTNAMSDTSSLEKMDRDIERFMTQWDLKGMQVSIMQDDSLIYSKGYGYADVGVQMGPGNIMRVASVSKLITAVGIMMLVDRDSLSLDDKVFGPDGIIDDPEINSRITDKRWYDITVEHLLRHQGGFSTRAGDPMFQTRTMMQIYNLSKAPSNRELIRLEASHRLKFAPGTSQDYSNFGYMVLSQIIEEVTGVDYETWMQESVLKPAGITDMHIAHNYYEEKYPNESRYYMHDNDSLVLEYNNSGNLVIRTYGGNDVRGLSGAGAWVCSSAELAKLVASIDGKPQVPDIISLDSVHRMTEYFDHEKYSLGWIDTDPDKGWVRTGTMSGTAALVYVYPDGQCWVLISNTGTWKGPKFSSYTKALTQQCRLRYNSSMPHRDLFNTGQRQ